MEFLPFIGLGAFLLTNVTAGACLLWRAARDRDLVMGMIGGALFFAGAVGPLLTTLARVVDARGGDVHLTWGSGLIALCLGAACLYVFTWRVFHPPGSETSRAASWAVILGFVMLFGGVGLQAAAGGFGQVGLHDPFAFLSQGARTASFAWAACASLREHAYARRRSAIGLCDPLTANRFLLWGVAATCACSLFALNLWRNLMGEIDPTSAVALAVVPAIGLGFALSMVLAFFPPAAYRSWVETRYPGYAAPATFSGSS